MATDVPAQALAQDPVRCRRDIGTQREKSISAGWPRTTS